MELATDVLEAAGFLVAQARTAEEGIRMATRSLPSLVLMDLSLPGMDGLAATRAIKGQPFTEHIPIVALTAHAMRGDAEIAMQAGCDGYICKPIDTRAFPEQIRGLITSLTLCQSKH